MLSIDDFCEPEWAEWYLLSPAERWQCSQQMWQSFLDLGGTLAPEPDTQSPFFDEDEWREMSSDGGTSLHIVRRSGV